MMKITSYKIRVCFTYAFFWQSVTLSWIILATIVVSPVGNHLEMHFEAALFSSCLDLHDQRGTSSTTVNSRLRPTLSKYKHNTMQMNTECKQNI